MNGTEQIFFNTPVPIEQIFRECFPKKMLREERRYAGLLADLYRSGLIDSACAIEMCELIKEMPVRPEAKEEFLKLLNFPVTNIETQVEGSEELTILKVVEQVQEGTENALASTEAAPNNQITRAMINTIHLNAASSLKLNGKGPSPEERKFLILISEWKRIGVIGEGTLNIIRKRVMEYMGDFPKENIDNIKKDLGGMSVEKFYRDGQRKKISFDFRSFSLEALGVLSPDIQKFIFKISRKGLLGKVCNFSMITQEQDDMLQEIFSSKKRIFPIKRISRTK